MSTPSKSTPIGINRGTQPQALNDPVGISATPQGTPDLRALRAAYVGTPPPPNIPLRVSTPGSNPVILDPAGVAAVSSSVSSSFPTRLGASQQPQSSDDPAPNASDPALATTVNNLPPEEKAKVLRRHLVSKEQRLQKDPEDTLHLDSGSSVASRPSSRAGPSGGGGASAPGPSAASVSREYTDPFPVYYHAPGADITHDIYKWQSDQNRQEHGTRRRRAASMTAERTAPQHPAFEHIHEPGGFRRNYLLLRACEEGQDEPPRILNTFVDFLYIFGHFAGEDLEDDELEEVQDEDLFASIESVEPTERTSLLRDNKFSRSISRTRRRALSSAQEGPHGNATVTQAVLMLLKSFIGTGVLFLGKAFYNGGILFSAGVFTFIALVSLYSFILLVETKFVVSGSFGDIGGALYGPWMRITILFSITLSQIGFVAAYTIFVAENLHSFVLGITRCAVDFSVYYFILLQLVVLLPLALIRDLAKLSTTALIADVFILAGLIYIFGSEITLIATRGAAQVDLFNPRDFPLFIGTAVFSFEGIGLVIPITDAMREPRRFPAVLSGVMIFLLVLFGGAGVLGYLTFGSQIQTVVLVNLDTSSKMVQAVQFLYSLAILLSIPLQLFPAVRILENWVFTRSGKGNIKVKWYKNVFRFAIVMGTTVISLVGAADLDKFVAFIGCFACVPLCYVYPAMLHLKACARSRKDRLKDYVMIIFGLVAAAYTTVQTIHLMIEPSPTQPPINSCASGNIP